MGEAAERGTHIRRDTPAEAVDLTDPEPDSRLIRILPHPSRF